MIGKKLKELKAAKGLTQEDIARELDVSPFTVQKWEQDKADPNTRTLIQLVDLLGTSIDYMLGLTEQKSGKEFLFVETFNTLDEDKQLEVMKYIDYLKKMM